MLRFGGQKTAGPMLRGAARRCTLQEGPKCNRAPDPSTRGRLGVSGASEALEKAIADVTEFTTLLDAGKADLAKAEMSLAALVTSQDPFEVHGGTHFHPKSISSTDTFIQTRFHPMRLSSMTLSTKTVSSNNNFIQ